jgi:hypothetical protein
MARKMPLTHEEFTKRLDEVQRLKGMTPEDMLNMPPKLKKSMRRMFEEGADPAAVVAEHDLELSTFMEKTRKGARPAGSRPEEISEKQIVELLEVPAPKAVAETAPGKRIIYKVRVKKGIAITQPVAKVEGVSENMILASRQAETLKRVTDAAAALAAEHRVTTRVRKIREITGIRSVEIDGRRMALEEIEQDANLSRKFFELPEIKGIVRKLQKGIYVRPLPSASLRAESLITPTRFEPEKLRLAEEVCRKMLGRGNPELLNALRYNTGLAIAFLDMPAAKELIPEVMADRKKAAKRAAERKIIKAGRQAQALKKAAESPKLAPQLPLPPAPLNRAEIAIVGAAMSLKIPTYGGQPIPFRELIEMPEAARAFIKDPAILNSTKIRRVMVDIAEGRLEEVMPHIPSAPASAVAEKAAKEKEVGKILKEMVQVTGGMADAKTREMVREGVKKMQDVLGISGKSWMRIDPKLKAQFTDAVKEKGADAALLEFGVRFQNAVIESKGATAEAAAKAFDEELARLEFEAELEADAKKMKEGEAGAAAKKIVLQSDYKDLQEYQKARNALQERLNISPVDWIEKVTEAQKQKLALAVIENGPAAAVDMLTEEIKNASRTSVSKQPITKKEIEQIEELHKHGISAKDIPLKKLVKDSAASRRFLGSPSVQRYFSEKAARERKQAELKAEIAKLSKLKKESAAKEKVKKMVAELKKTEKEAKKKTKTTVAVRL